MTQPDGVCLISLKQRLNWFLCSHEEHEGMQDIAGTAAKQFALVNAL